MGVEIDPVILQLRADVNKYLADLRSTTTKVDKLLDQQVASARNLEREMRRSSAAISGHLKGLAASIAGYFTGRELVGLLDNFTRLQNQLKVAGLEGAALAQVQDHLFATGQRYGVSVNALAELYGKATQAGKDLGASQAQLLALTDATAQALLITGTSTEAASGAILGLSQALASGTVRAEEFNQMNEGGLAPLLQAVAATERFGGSIGKLRLAVVDGKVSSKEFYTAALKNAQLLEGQASKATLTLSAGFTAITNSLTKYLGEADKANGVSAALGEALGVLADNLETLIPAIALVATAMGVRYVVGATAAAGATIMASNAMFALQARALGAATSMEALAFAMNGMKGGLVTVAILALGGAFYYLATREQTAADAALRYQEVISKSAASKTNAIDLARKLAAAVGEERRATELAIATTLKKARADQIAAAASLNRARAELASAQAREASVRKSAAATPGRGSAEIGTVKAETERQLRLKTGEVRALTEAQKNLNDAVKVLNDPLKVPPLPGLGNVGVGADDTKKKKGKGGGGPTATEIAHRHADEMSRLNQEELQAQMALTDDAETRADLAYQLLQAEYEQRLAQIANDEHFTAAQKKAQSDALKALYGVKSNGDIVVDAEAGLLGKSIRRDKLRQLEQEAQQLADEEFNAQRDALQIQYDLADSQSERKRLALEILDAEQKHLRSVLDAIIASETATEADKERAKVARDGLDAIAAGQRTRAVQQNETQRDRYLRELNKSPEAINEAIDGIKIDGLDALNNGLVEAIQGTKSLGDVFKDVANQIIADLLRIAIQRAIIQPLANAIFGAGAAALGGGAGAGITVTRGGSIPLPGRASGGRVNAGQMYRVNEASPIGKVEGFRPDSSGDIIPLGRMNAPAMGLQQSGNARVQIELSGDIDGRIARVSGPVAVEIVRSAAPSIIDASAREAFARGRRPSL